MTEQEQAMSAARRREVTAALEGEMLSVDGGVYQPNGDIIALLRLASKRLEGRRQHHGLGHSGQMCFPGWDFTHISDRETLDRYHRIRNAAYLIHGEADCDAAKDAKVDDVAALLHYIGDMLEL